MHVLGPAALHQRTIELAQTVVLQALLQFQQRGAIARQKQTAAGIAIKPVNEFDGIGWTQQAHDIDDAPVDARARMNRQPGRFVEHQNVLVFEQDCLFQATQLFSRGRLVSRALWFMA